MVVPEYHEHACGCDGALPFCRQVVCSGWFWRAIESHKKKHLAFPFFTFFGHYVNPKYLKLMGRWETYLGFHRFPASFSTGSLLTKSGWYFFVFKHIYICGCIYQLPVPIYKMVFQIFYKMEVPDTGIWSCSHIKWCWVCINRSLSTKWSAPTAKKKHKIWFIGGPRPTILNGKCQRGSCLWM